MLAADPAGDDFQCFQHIDSSISCRSVNIKDTFSFCYIADMHEKHNSPSVSSIPRWRANAIRTVGLPFRYSMLNYFKNFLWADWRIPGSSSRWTLTLCTWPVIENLRSAPSITSLGELRLSADTGGGSDTTTFKPCVL